MRKNFIKNRIYFAAILLLFFGISLGYALISSNLQIGTNIVVKGLKSKNLYDYIMVNAVMDNTSSEYVTSSEGIKFNSVGSKTNGLGIYIKSDTVSNTYPIYYYRGAVTDNNVKFGGFCWKILRTTETGGIKLLYNGVFNNGSCNNEGYASQIGVSSFNTYTNPSLSDVGFMYGDRYETSTTLMTGKKYTYGNDVTYSDGMYTLVNDNTPSLGWALSYSSLRNGYRYTCMSNETSCSSVYYMYGITASNAYHVILSNGVLLSDVIGSATSNSSNSNNSTIKSSLDNWYLSNMSSYTSMLEDTVWCNDRSIYEYSGWDKDSNSTSDLHFNGYVRNFLTYTPSVDCNNNSDKFTVNVSNGNGKLTYPVGIITADEVILASGSTDSFIHSGNSYWTMTPSYYGDSTTGAHNYVFGTILESLSSVKSEYGVRPVISLKHGTEYVSGTGLIDDPFIIE